MKINYLVLLIHLFFSLIKDIHYKKRCDFCSLFNYEKEVKEIKNYLNQGLSLDEIFIMLPFPTLFKE